MRYPVHRRQDHQHHQRLRSVAYIDWSRQAKIGSSYRSQSFRTSHVPSVWKGCSKRSESTPMPVSSTNQSIRIKLRTTKKHADGQILEEGITEAGSMSSFVAAGTAYSAHGINMIPFYIYYSMFGFQRVGDSIWAAADMRAKGFLDRGNSWTDDPQWGRPAAPRWPQPPQCDRVPDCSSLRSGLGV